MAMPTSITAPDLFMRLGTPTCPVIIDVTIDADFKADPFLIPASIRLTHTDIPMIKSRLADRAAIIVCQKGRKLSQGVAAWLRHDGSDAIYLENGMYGWRDHPGAPRIPGTALPPGIENGSVWVAAANPAHQDIACWWLVRRFVDPQARCLVVEPQDVDAVAEKFNAVPLLARAGQYDYTSFDGLRDRLGLKTPALSELSRTLSEIGKDPGRRPNTAGLAALMDGQRRLCDRDLDVLNAGVGLFDALYQWAFGKTSQSEEVAA